ncbi:MAG: hypothetical protein AB4372_27680 [Xenococcus sp. (in: cyanobacteria)]
MKSSLPQDIINFFFDSVIGRVDIIVLEQWLYQETRLEEFLNPDDYLDLISLDFREAKLYEEKIRYSIGCIIAGYIDISEYEAYRLKSLLCDFLDRKGNLVKILDEFYDLYCHGYKFLGSLGYPYGCTISSYLYELEDDYYRNFFPKSYTKEDIAKEIQAEIIADLPVIDKEIKQVLTWLESGEIEVEIKIKKPSYDYYLYQQNFNHDYYLSYIDRRN